MRRLTRPDFASARVWSNVNPLDQSPQVACPIWIIVESEPFGQVIPWSLSDCRKASSAESAFVIGAVMTARPPRTAASGAVNRAVFFIRRLLCGQRSCKPRCDDAAEVYGHIGQTPTSPPARRSVLGGAVIAERTSVGSTGDAIYTSK